MQKQITRIVCQRSWSQLVGLQGLGHGLLAFGLGLDSVASGLGCGLVASGLGIVASGLTLGLVASGLGLFGHGIVNIIGIHISTFMFS